jgi:hypothetical protein
MIFSFFQARAVAHSHARASSRVIHATATTATRASCSRCVIAVAAAASSSFVLAMVAVYCSSTVERLELLPGIVGGGLSTILERDVPMKVKCLYCLMNVHIYMGQPTQTLV